MVDDEPDIIRDRVFLRYPLLLKATKLARERNYNQQVTDEFINKTIPEADPDQNCIYPIMFSIPHEHAQGEPVDPHIRCKILGPWGDEAEPVVSILLDVDMDLFNSLPNTSIYNGITEHPPSASSKPRLAN